MTGKITEGRSKIELEVSGEELEALRLIVRYTLNHASASSIASHSSVVTHHTVGQALSELHRLVGDPK